ncbi:MAG: restriction endonuclease [Methanomethylovorans sp.]|nr:restriction endonuclease [Methanomethylovorans sp.]
MTIPDFQSIMLPLLEYLNDEKEHSHRETIDHICSEFKLTEKEKQETLQNGQSIIGNRISWAKVYMSKAGLIESTRRGFYRITQRGKTVLNEKPVKVNIRYLKQFPEFLEFQAIKYANIKKEQDTTNSKDFTQMETEAESVTPDELMENGFNSIQASLGQELLTKLRSNTPSFFEKVVLDLLSNMGYGEGKVTGKTGDGGVDGLINQDRLGLDKIFFQAKRFGEDTPVSASMLRDFVGTLEVNGVSKGVFMTTSRFPKDAENVISRSHKSIVLVDGPKLVKLMIDFNIGVSTTKTYEIKRIDSDYFIEE